MITNANNVVRYQISGNSYAITYGYWDKQEIKVYLTDADGSIRLVALGVDYTLTDADGVSGTLTKISDWGDATRITIQREVDLTQERDLVNGQTVDAEVLESALDHSMAAIQQLNEGQSRSLKFSVDEAGSDITLPNKDTRKGSGSGTIMGFDSTGDAAIVRDLKQFDQDVQNTASNAASALASKNAAAISESNAAAAAGASAAAAAAAHSSEVNAANSENNAAASAITAGNAKNDAVAAKDAAVQAKTDAISAKNIAVQARENAQTYAGNASASASAAATSETNAHNSEVAAAGSASSAASNATSAGNSATSALNSKNAAAISETNAHNSEVAAAASKASAATSETNAAASKNAAATSETNAHNSEVAAATSETNAAASKSAAASSEQNAATSETNASNSATSAGNSKLDSEAWAVGKRNGVDVGPDDPTYHNNAKFYAESAGGMTPITIAEIHATIDALFA